MSDRRDTPWALVTGASKGIGAATAQALAAGGFNIVVHYGGDERGAQAVAEQCAAAGVQSRVVGADLAGDLRPLVEVVEGLGGVRVLVNNAGITNDGLAIQATDDDLDRAWQVNTAAAFKLSRTALRGMIRGRAGRIVNVTSVVGLHGNAGQAVYATTKAALVGLTKTLAREVGKRGITVNAVAPGFIDTAMTADLDLSAAVAAVPAGRTGTPEEVAAVIAFLCSDAASYVNGEVITVDGGLFA